MSHFAEHRRLKPVLDLARTLDADENRPTATNPAPEALFEAGTAGFQIWCTPEDYPAGWEGVPMDRGAFAKPCAYVASVGWVWNEDDDDPRIIALALSTDAYALRDRQGPAPGAVHNRPDDIAWAKNKIRWLFAQAGVILPPIRVAV